MGAESIEYYGGKSTSTPNWNRLATLGLSFDRFYSNPSCTPSRATLVSGRYPFRTGMQKNGAGRFLPHKDCSIGLAMRNAGYRTAMIGM